MALPKYTMDLGSTEYRRILVTASDDSGAIDPTPYDVHVAFVAPGTQPSVEDWQEAEWVTTSGRYYARVLVGPDGGVELLETDYYVYVRIDAGIEFPHKLAGILCFQ